jgi:hypothetical protein
MTRILMTCCAALLLVPAVALADTRIDERHNLAPGGRIELSNVAGKVTVRGWDRNDVQLTGTLSDGLQLNVPRSVELLLSTVSASQEISGIDVRRLQADTVSGSLSASGRSGDSKLNTVSGSVNARLQTPRLDVNTVSGRIEAGGGVSGDIGAQTVSGRVDVDAGRVQRLVVETVSGSVDLAAAGLAPGGRINVESVSASVNLRLPRTVSAQLSVNSFSGSINSDAGDVERPRYGPGSRLDTRLGGGDGDIRIQSHSGSVQVRLDR